jgi:hypothetical protein
MFVRWLTGCDAIFWLGCSLMYYYVFVFVDSRSAVPDKRPAGLVVYTTRPAGSSEQQTIS